MEQWILQHLGLDLRDSTPDKCLSASEVRSSINDMLTKYPAIVGYKDTSALTQTGLKPCFESAVRMKTEGFPN